MKYQTASREYFDQVIAGMKEQGFELLAWVTLHTEMERKDGKGKLVYHVDLHRFTQEAHLFFVAPGKTFIVKLELYEHFGFNHGTQWEPNWEETYVQRYWSGFVCYNYRMDSWIKHVIKEAEEKAKGRMIFSDELDYNLHLTVGPHYRWAGSAGYARDFEQVNACCSKELLPAELVTAPFGPMFRKLEAHLYRKFNELQVTGFAPHYTFPDQEEEFWARFPLPRLRRLAGRIWGSDFGDIG